MAKFRKGAAVTWKWRAHTARGKVAESFTHDVTRTIKGERVKRTVSAGEPAWPINLEDSRRVLKSHSELSRAGRSSAAAG